MADVVRTPEERFEGLPGYDCGLIPGACEQVRIERAAQFLQEDRGEEIADLIVRFTAGATR
jgi:hypothetical protein